MKSIGKFIAEKTLIIQFILFLLLLVGLSRLLSMHREAFPNVALDKIVIEAPLPTVQHQNSCKILYTQPVTQNKNSSILSSSTKRTVGTA